MSVFVLSRHAETRMGQRGRRPSDLELIWRYGTEIGSDTLYLGRKDVRREVRLMNREIRRLNRLQRASANVDRQREIRRLKRQIQALERLSGWKLVVANDTVVTCYRSSRQDRKRTLRRGKEFV